MTTINTVPQAAVRGKSREASRLLFAAPYLLPALLIFAVFTYYPLAKVIYLSFTNAADYITRSIDLIVQLERVGGDRRIHSIKQLRAN